MDATPILHHLTYEPVTDTFWTACADGTPIGTPGPTPIAALCSVAIICSTGLSADPEHGPQEDEGEGDEAPSFHRSPVVLAHREMCRLFAAETAQAERIAAAHRLGSGPALWWEVAL